MVMTRLTIFEFPTQNSERFYDQYDIHLYSSDRQMIVG